MKGGSQEIAAMTDAIAIILQVFHPIGCTIFSQLFPTIFIAWLISLLFLHFDVSLWVTLRFVLQTCM